MVAITEAEAKEIAREIIKEVLVEHIACCPHHQEFVVTRARFTGIVTGVAIAAAISGGSVGAAVSILIKSIGG